MPLAALGILSSDHCDCWEYVSRCKSLEINRRIEDQRKNCELWLSLRAHPCSECHLLDFVAPQHKSTEVPCHHIALNEEGTTIEDLELTDNQAKMETTIKRWLKDRIVEIESWQPKEVATM